jgi:hypothetical protein
MNLHFIFLKTDNNHYQFFCLSGTEFVSRLYKVLKQIKHDDTNNISRLVIVKNLFIPFKKSML